MSSCMAIGLRALSAKSIALPTQKLFLKKPRTGSSLVCALGCDAGGRDFEIPTGPTLRVFK